MTQTIERRLFAVEAELRAAKGRTIEGYAARYNILSSRMPLGEAKRGKQKFYRERLAPGAFKQAVQEKQDVTMLVQHDNDKVLGRTASGTLVLGEDSKGLHFRCSMPNTQLGNDTYESIQRGDLNACSFSFLPGENRSSFAEEDFEDEIDDNIPDDYDEDKPKKRDDGKMVRSRIIRTVHSIPRLLDVSVVTRPAYPVGTSVVARALEFDEYRSLDIPQEVIDRFCPKPPTQADSDELRARRRNLLNTILS